MPSANQMLTRAARALGTLGRTETLGGIEANDGLDTFNALIDSWSNEKLMSHVTLQRSFTLTANTQSYTIGSGGVINVARPLDITQAFVRDGNGQDYGLDIVTREIWNTIGDKSITSQIPTTLFYDSGFTLGTIYIFPVPTVALTVFYDSTTNQVTFSTLTQSLSMPPGYERCFVQNLALELMASGYPCLLNPIQLQALVDSAREGKANIKRTNIKEVLASVDEALVNHASATYNPYRDSQ